MTGRSQNTVGVSPASPITNSQSPRKQAAATNDERFSDSGGCKVDEAGDYIWALSPGGGYLTLDVIQDVCSARADAMDGTFERVACPNFPKNFCLGDLEAGEHQAITFLPLVPVAEWERDRGAMTYTVPNGWSNDGDHPDEYVIQPQDRTGDVGIFMWSEAAIVESASPCSPNPDPNIARTPAAMATWLTDHPKLLTTEPTPASIGGLDGLTLDVSVRPDATLDCLGGAVPYVPMLVHAKATGMQWGFNEDTHMRFFLLDLGDGRTLVISIEAPDPATFESLLHEAMDILESIRFRL